MKRILIAAVLMFSTPAMADSDLETKIKVLINISAAWVACGYEAPSFTAPVVTKIANDHQKKPMDLASWIDEEGEKFAMSMTGYERVKFCADMSRAYNPNQPIR